MLHARWLRWSLAGLVAISSLLAMTVSSVSVLPARAYYNPSNADAGLAPWMTFVTIPIGKWMTLHANVANGNLLLTTEQIHLPGVNGLDEVIGPHWNSWQSDYCGSALGCGWSWNTGPDVVLNISGSTYTFQDPSGQHYAFTKSGSTFIAPPGIDAALTEDGAGYHLTMNASGLQYTFTSSGDLANIKNRQGNQLAFTNGGSNLTNTEGQTTSISASGQNKVLVTIGTSSWYYYVDPTAQLLTGMSPDDGVPTTSFGYNSNKLLSQITDPNNNTTNLTYGGNNYHEVSSIRAAGYSTAWTFRYSTGSTAVTDPNGHVTTYVYDSRGRVTSITDANSNTTSYTWTADNHIQTIRKPSGATTTFSYDGNNNLTGISYPSGAAVSAQYTDPTQPYQPTSITDAQGNTTAYQYNTQGLLGQVTDALGHTTSYSYNPSGGIDGGTLASMTDPNSQQTTYSYTTHGLLGTITYPSPLGAHTYTYNSFDWPATETDGKNQVTTSTYDPLGELTAAAYTGGASVQNTIDGDGNLTQRVDSTGTTTYTYNGFNQQTQKKLPNGHTITSSWDAVGNLLTKTDGGGTVTYGYDAGNRLTSVKDPQNVSIGLGYDQDNNRTSITFPNGVTEGLSYNGDGNLTQIGATKGTTSLTSFSYSYTNPSSQPTLLRYSMTDVNNAVTTYTYDALNRLTQAVQGGTTDSYSYDNGGNMTSATLGGTQVSMGYNSANELTAANGTTYGFDGNGSETGNSAGLSLSYNAQNQTTSITPPGGSAESLAYSGIGQPEQVTGGAMSYQYDETGIGSTTTGGSSTYYTRTPDGMLLAERIPGGGKYYYLVDGLGSVVALTDSTGTVVNTYHYDPYGNATASETVANPFRFDGALWDSSTHLYQDGGALLRSGSWTMDPDGPTDGETTELAIARSLPLRRRRSCQPC